jgi:hypothetical protein
VHKWIRNNLLASKLEEEHDFKLNLVHHGFRKKLCLCKKRLWETQQAPRDMTKTAGFGMFKDGNGHGMGRVVQYYPYPYPVGYKTLPIPIHDGLPYPLGTRWAGKIVHKSLAILYLLITNLIKKLIMST